MSPLDFTLHNLARGAPLDKDDVKYKTRANYSRGKASTILYDIVEAYIQLD